ncbi:hypothetical protein BT69DRAFT_1344727 [Atractiella rhizophila]|nr:hypothetical protein BT69DRAFT_1344727 [Atractiella rhizophila]
MPETHRPQMVMIKNDTGAAQRHAYIHEPVQLEMANLCGLVAGLKTTDNNLGEASVFVKAADGYWVLKSESRTTFPCNSIELLWHEFNSRTQLTFKECDLPHPIPNLSGLQSDSPVFDKLSDTPTLYEDGLMLVQLGIVKSVTIRADSLKRLHALFKI